MLHYLHDYNYIFILPILVLPGEFSYLYSFIYILDHSKFEIDLTFNRLLYYFHFENVEISRRIIPKFQAPFPSNLASCLSRMMSTYRQL